MRGLNEAWAAARRDVVAEIRAGRVSRAEVASALGVTREAVRRWVRREEAQSRFVAVEVCAAPEGGATLEVVVAGGRVVRVPPSFDAAELVRVVRALESC